MNFKYDGEYRPLDSTTRDKLRNTLQDLELVIIDEISMVTSNFLYFINSRLGEIFLSEDYFAGKCVLLVGDIMQMDPPKGKFIFDEPANKKYQPLHGIDPLWLTFDVAVLDTNHRQGEGNFWTEMLNRFRLGIVLDDDKEKLESRRLQNFPNLNTDDAVHVFYTNREVDTQNMKILRSMNTKTVALEARTAYPRGYKPVIKPHGTIDKTHYKKVLELSIGSNVVLIANIDIADSLVNGARGMVTDFIIDDNGIMRAVMVQFDNPEAGIESKRSSEHFCKKFKVNSSGIPIFRKDFEYRLPFKKGTKSHSCKGKISQFPLRLADASTAHKLQGTTNKRGKRFVVHGYKPMPKAMAYVMLSRVTDFNDLYIDENFDTSMIQYIDAAMAENDRLNERSIIPKIRDERYDCFILNINRLIPHLIDLEHDIYATKSDIVCVVETWMDSNNEWNINSQLGTFFSCSAGMGKGVGAFLPKNSKQPNYFCQNDYQILTTKFKYDSNLNIIYLSSNNYSLGDVVTAIDNILRTGGVHLFVGDFNFMAGEKNIITDYFQRKGFTQLVTVPTQEKGRIIDHVYVPTIISKYVEVNYAYPYYSDHVAILLKYQIE